MTVSRLKEIADKYRLEEGELSLTDEGIPSIPKNLHKKLLNHEHSLGKHDCFPPESEVAFDFSIIEQRFAETYKNLSKFEDLVGLSPEDLQHVLNDLVKRCVEIERPIRLKLEILCMAIANDLFDIPEESILFKCSLVDRVDLTNKRKTPEKSDDVEFNHTQEMEELNKEVYKRRLINSLIQGASLKYSSEVKNYIDDIYELNYDLPKIYEKIIAINNHLLFYNDDEETSSTVGGNCESYLGDSSKPSSVHASALIFPLLLNECFRGVLEILSAHGLPKEKNKAMYVIKKSDFLLAENWDIRFGYTLWQILIDLINENGENPIDLGIPFIFIELIQMPVTEFNFTFRELFAKTRMGKERMKNVCDKIHHDKCKDIFDDFVEQKNNEYQRDFSDQYFMPDELS
jgi:hypothetical protein